MVEKSIFSGTCIFRVIGFLRPSPHIPPPKKNMLFLEKDVRNIVEKLSKLSSKSVFCKIWYIEFFQQWKFFFSNLLRFFHHLFFTPKTNPRKFRLVIAFLTRAILTKWSQGLTVRGRYPSSKLEGSLKIRFLLKNAYVSGNDKSFL